MDKLHIFNDDLGIIHKELTQAFKQPMARVDNAPTKLRASMLPYCGLRAYYEMVKGKDVDSINMLGETYMSVGTTVHTVLQTLLPQLFDKIQILGNWKGCKTPGCPVSKEPQIFDAEGCPKCKLNPLYVEISDRKFISARMDSVYIVKGTKRAYIIDYKTSSSKNLYKMKYDKTYSSYSPENPCRENTYRWQMDAYAVVFAPLLKKLGYTLSGLILLYISRDKPDNFHLRPVRNYPIDDELLQQIRANLLKMVNGFDGILDLENKKKSPKMKYLPYFHNLKICPSKSFYDENVHSQWNPCPLADVCFNKKELWGTFRELMK